jgi:hypothetical protein
MKPITLPAMAASLLFSSAPTAGISAATQPQLGGALALGLAGAALIALGFVRRRKPAARTQGDVRPVSADPSHQPSFFRETDMTDNSFDPNGLNGAKVIDFTSAQLERGLIERAERVCGRYLNREEEDHADESLEA